MGCPDDGDVHLAGLDEGAEVLPYIRHFALERSHIGEIQVRVITKQQGTSTV